MKWFWTASALVLAAAAAIPPYELLNVGLGSMALWHALEAAVAFTRSSSEGK